MFSKLRGVTLDQLDKVIATFTEDDWDQLETGFLDVASQLINDMFEPLQPHPDTDVSYLFCRLYQISLARNPEVAP